MENKGRRQILITGGAGFIGFHLAFQLSQDPINHIVMVDNFMRGQLDKDLEALVKKPNIQLIEGDLTESTTFAKLGSGFHEIYHLAAVIGVRNVLHKPHEVIRINTMSTLLLLDWFVNGGGMKLLYASTSEVYGWTQQFHELPVPTPENIPLSLTDLSNPRSSYAGSKIFGELAVSQLCLLHEKPFTIVRYHNVYGPRMGNAHVIPELCQRSINGQNPLIVYSANHSRAFCYVSDAVAGTIGAMREKDASGRTINIGYDLEEVTMGELADRILKKANITANITPKTALNDPIVRRAPDLTQARKILRYNPQVTLDEGLELFISWYEKRNKSKKNDDL